MGQVTDVIVVNSGPPLIVLCVKQARAAGIDLPIITNSS